MAATSMMKEYVKRQLKYWLDNFKDDQLPRDFNAKSFARSQISLHKITLKPDKIAALLHVPAPLIVTRATCSELSIKVPSWSQPEKLVQEPLTLRLGDLFVDIKHFAECDEHVRRDSVARARAASLEPDPLGSFASMYQFATAIGERLEVLVDNVYVKLYEKHALRLRVEMTRFHARTTNALWQDMRDLTDCVDRSPDGLLKTRFKFVSAQCSVYLHELGGALSAEQQAPPPLRLLRDHAIAMRVTLFGHRKSKQDAWATLSRVVDLHLDTLPFEMDAKQVRQVFEACATLSRWLAEASTGTSDVEIASGPLPHELVRGPLTPKRKGTEGFQTDEPSDGDEKQDKSQDSTGGSTFALQVTVRFTAHALIRFHSERRGDIPLAVIAQHAAVNWIQHHDDNASELQVTVHDLSVRHKDKVLFHVKPAREVLQYKRLPGNSIFLKWHLQKLECHLEKEIAVIANEIFHSFKEIEQAAAITCGTCHNKIRLDSIETHVCIAASGSPRSAPASPVANNSRDTSSPKLESKPLIDSTQIPKLRVVFALDELEVITDSFLLRSVQELMRLAADPAPLAATPAQRFVVRMKDWSVSTESKEFVGDAIFVPVLPLAFQMLECTIRGCGCVHKQQQQQRRKQAGDAIAEGDTEDTCSLGRELPRWPDRIFAELGHLSIKATNNATNAETFVVADGSSLRLSFSDGVKVCPHSTPQMSCYFHVERIRCQMEHTVYQRVRRAVTKLQDPFQGHAVAALTLFFAVMEIRNVELTLLHERDSSARIKAQFRHVGGVADNHHGRLSLQTNFDFRALLQSESVTFDFPAPADGECEPNYETKRERRRRREQEQRKRSAQQIQRVFRVFAAARRAQLASELRRLTREDEDPASDQQPDIREPSAHESESSTQSRSSTRRKSAGKASMFGSAEDIAAINPMKMVAAAGVLKDGVLGFVKAKGQLLESEMTELAMHSKESASRFMPKYSAMKNLLSPKGPGSPVADVGRKTAEVRDAESEREHEEQEVQDEVDDAGEVQESRSKQNSRTEMAIEGTYEDETLAEEIENGPVEGNSDPVVAVEVDEPREDGGEEVPDKPFAHTMETHEEPPLSPVETLLASLPPVVRLMVQVEEHRLCVPIDPRASVSVLCHEIVRRFNEMFASNGVITHVTLQNPQGGVFAGSDVIGLVCDSVTKPNELFYAYPHDEDGEIKSVVQINPSYSPGKETKTASFSTNKKRVTCAFTRCSKLPLPLVVALLANETERELLRHVLKDGSTAKDEWPELALNASFLDPTKEMLQVEVRWQGSSLEVTNHDAFLLCLQQLGLCTSRENSKHVGKILRDRLKMDTKNPLIRMACHASPDLHEEIQSRDSDTKEPRALYDSLKDIVQEDFGVYMRVRD